MTNRRHIEIFNLSLLDVLTGVLGAIIFLLIVVPKGTGKLVEYSPEMTVRIDKRNNKLFGDIPKNMNLFIADTVKVVIYDYGVFPEFEDCPPCPEIKEGDNKIVESKPCPPCPKCPGSIISNKIGDEKDTENHDNSEDSEERILKRLAGDLPSVPCKLSIEINWELKDDNVDLYVCKSGKCVSGAKREIKDVGSWVSGKPKTKFFGADLRTNQEAIRQMDDLIPGEYNIYVEFKESLKQNSTVDIQGLIYTHPEKSIEYSERFRVILDLKKGDRIFIGTINVFEDGKFQFLKKYDKI
jgi:hypothetical protein